jgi:hypothetical protein
MWVSSRRNVSEDVSRTVKVDLKHIDEKIFILVLRHIYADTGDELFDDIATGSLDDFLDTVIEVMSAANELMLGRLAQVCQEVVGRYVNARNVCSLLNTIAECSVDSFKRAALEYICLNLEGMLELRLLDELDEDLWFELDEVVKANQMAFLPFARSGRAEAELIEQYPELLGQIETSKQRRVDSMRLRTRLVQGERETVTVKHQVGSLERHVSSTLIKDQAPSPADESPLTTPTPSPAIVANDASDDLPFDMDEDQPRFLPGPAIKGRQALVASTAVDTPGAKILSSSNLATSPSPVGTPRIGPENREISDFGQSVTPGSPAFAVGGFTAQRRPWQRPTIDTGKSALRDIMEQDSASRVSNLTQAMQSLSTPSKPAPKLSQKERKRQQQQMKGESPNVQAISSPSAPTSKPTSPWQTVAKPRPTMTPTVSTPSPQTDSKVQVPPRPAMTMRQTVAGAPTRAVSTNATSGRGAPPSSLQPTAKAATPQIQSIRHTPVASRTPSGLDALTSMTEILAQQQTEKAAIKEAVAKRSLQEIQQEQEFQAWWDSESRRIQEEEAQVNAAIGRERNSNGGRGGQRRGGIRGGKKSQGEKISKEPADVSMSTGSPSVSHAEKPGGGRGRGRERERGRGQASAPPRGPRQMT